MDTPRFISLLAFGSVSDELEQVLLDARCSFVAADGRCYFATSEEPPGSSPEAARFAADLFAQPGPDSSTSTIDLGAGRVPGVRAELINPITLLHWVVAQRAAVDFHPTVNAYLGSSDPDDILPYLPFHPAPGKGDDGISVVVAVRVRHVADDQAAGRPVLFRIAGLGLLLPDEAPGA